VAGQGHLAEVVTPGRGCERALVHGHRGPGGQVTPVRGGKGGRSGLSGLLCRV